jgi:type IV secretory pathway VirD2 relaxase
MAYPHGACAPLERLQKLASEVEQERLTRLDRVLMARAKDGILVPSSAGELSPAHQTMQAGRLKTLERLGLAEERRPEVWALDAARETKLPHLGERADTYGMMERALKQAASSGAGRSLPSSNATGARRRSSAR